MFDIETEKAIAESFFSPHHTRRVLSLLDKKRGRQKFINLLPHSLVLDPQNSRPISKDEQDSTKILELLKKLGAPPICYVISEDPNIDSSQSPLNHTVDQVLYNGFASIVSCIPGKLGLYVNEDCEDIYLLHRK